MVSANRTGEAPVRCVGLQMGIAARGGDGVGTQTLREGTGGNDFAAYVFGHRPINIG